MRKYLLLALLGLMITGCSKNAPIIPVKPVDSASVSYSTSLPHDFRNGTWGEGRVAVESYENGPHNHADSSYDASSQMELIGYYNTNDDSQDSYFFNQSGKLAAGIHVTAMNTDNNQKTALFNALVLSYQAKYGTGTVNIDNMTATWYSKRSMISISEQTLDTYLYEFFIAYTPLSSAETAIDLHKHVLQPLHKSRSL